MGECDIGELTPSGAIKHHCHVHDSPAALCTHAAAELERRVQETQYALDMERVEFDTAMERVRDLESRLARCEHENERLLRNPTTAEVARLRSVVEERDVEQARLQRELNLRVEMLVEAVDRFAEREHLAQAEATVARLQKAVVEADREFGQIEAYNTTFLHRVAERARANLHRALSLTGGAMREEKVLYNLVAIRNLLILQLVTSGVSIADVAQTAQLSDKEVRKIVGRR